MKTAQGFYAPIREELGRVRANIQGLASSSAPEMKGLLAHVVEGRGKWVRPAITILASRLRHGPADAAVTMATAVELLHLATLIHDDTVDNADTRRGMATLSSVWGPEMAVLVGDYLFAASALFVCDTGEIRVIRRFSQTIMELSTGELAERVMAFNWRQTRQDNLQRVYNKTASLFATAAESGALLGGAPEEDVQRLRSFGVNIGMAFQVVDDILDFEGSATEVGKPVGNDLAQGVLTLPALLMLEKHQESNPVVALCQSRDAARYLDLAVQAVRESGATTEAYAIAGAYRQEALAQLAPIPDSPYKRSLMEVAGYVVGRSR